MEEINIAHLIGKKVFVELNDIDNLKSVGIENEYNMVTVVGQETRHGIWIETKGIKSPYISFPEDNTQEITGIVFIPWRHISNIVYYPNHQELSIQMSKSRKVGFRQD